MGHFDRLALDGVADAAIDLGFREKSDGKVVFYPWGVKGNGYIVTPGKESQIRAFLRVYMRVSSSLVVLALFLGIVFTGILLKNTTLWAGLLILLVMGILGYAASMPYLIADLPRVGAEKRSFAEEYQYIHSTGKITPEALRPMIRSHCGVWILALLLHYAARAFWLG